MSDLGPLFERPLSNADWEALRPMLHYAASIYMDRAESQNFDVAQRFQAYSWLLLFKSIMGEDDNKLVSMAYLMELEQQILGVMGEPRHGFLEKREESNERTIARLDLLCRQQ